MTTAVEARGLVQRYGRRTVLPGVDLTIRSGGVTGLVGPNGAGKTTLLATISTLMRPAAGQLRTLGLDPVRRTERALIRRRSGFLPQSFGFVPSFTVEEFVGYACWLKGTRSRELAAAVQTAVERVNLGPERTKAMGKLSGGMLRRAGIAATIVHQPDLLILDEPTVGLDPEQRMDFRALLRRLGEAGTVLLSTHLIEDIAATCTNVVVIRHGSVVFSGRTGELADRADPAGAVGSPLERGYAALAIAEAE